MTATLLFLALFLLGLLLALRPLLGPREPFPEPPRREELLRELEVLKEEVEALEGEERKRALARMVEVERLLEGYRPPAPRPFNPWPVALVLGAVVLLGVGLWRYTLPRLPGETTVTQRQEARELKALADKAKRTGEVEDLLAWGRKAYELQALDQAAEAYLEVLKKDPRNVEAVRRVGILLFMGGRPEEARIFLEIAQHADPKAAEGWLFLGNLYFQEGRMQEAIAAWERYLEAGGEAKERVEALIAMAKAQAQGGKDGKSVYEARCAACHGLQGEGGVGPRLKGNPILKAPEAVREIVLKGRGTMPAVPLSEEELGALLDYLGSL
ncbi:cytochrome c biogenesis factor [Thermus thermophilus]|uniref:c-type cytochrome n=1 Tax=Thermus thermophilus TaxID=274 RepID=UPI00090C74E7|nr:cytochrome c [Thermus thermophilus]BAW02576.1 cytochrome c biogenesis factor [Thermus thermophilus]BDB10808.1 cystathionine beta-synthase [Thermus thermophilus]